MAVSWSQTLGIEFWACRMHVSAWPALGAAVGDHCSRTLALHAIADCALIVNHAGHHL